MRFWLSGLIRSHYIFDLQLRSVIGRDLSLLNDETLAAYEPNFLREEIRHTFSCSGVLQTREAKINLLPDKSYMLSRNRMTGSGFPGFFQCLLFLQVRFVLLQEVDNQKKKKERNSG